jgi:hypothetical protein
MTQKCDFPLQTVKIPEGISCGDERERDREREIMQIVEKC